LHLRLLNPSCQAERSRSPLKLLFLLFFKEEGRAFAAWIVFIEFACAMASTPLSLTGFLVFGYDL